MSNPTQKEIEAISKFQERLKDLDLTKQEYRKEHLLRWLRARDLDLDKAEEMLRKSIIYRDEITEELKDYEIPEIQDSWYFSRLVGRCKEGLPVFVQGKMDLDKMLMEVEDIEKFFRFTYEKCFQTILSHSTPEQEIAQSVTIQDYSDIQISQFLNFKAMDLMKKSTKLFEANYPEILRSGICINVPKAFYILYEVLKPIIPAKTLEKIEIYDSNELKWRTALLKRISANNLPRSYGGISDGPYFNFITGKTDEKSVGCIGGSKTKLGKDDFIPLNIPAKDKLPIQFTIDKNAKYKKLSYKFKTDHYNIGFSVNYKDKEIVPYKLVESNLNTVEGDVCCSEVGKYELIFDNSFSKLRAKTLYYWASLD